MELRYYAMGIFFVLEFSGFPNSSYFGKAVNFHLLLRINDMRPLIFLLLDSSEIRRTLEPKLISQIGTLNPHGINEHFSFN